MHDELEGCYEKSQCQFRLGSPLSGGCANESTVAFQCLKKSFINLYPFRIFSGYLKLLKPTESHPLTHKLILYWEPSRSMGPPPKACILSGLLHRARAAANLR